MSIITGVLTVYKMVNTRRSVGRQEFASLMDSATYGQFACNLFIVSILGTRLLRAEEIIFSN
jgi:hypothetical protein